MPPVIFLDQLPTKQGTLVPISVQPLTVALIEWWQAHIQPHIARLDRADAQWDWYIIDGLCGVSGRGFGQDPRGYAITLPSLRDPAGQPLIVALLYLARRYPYLPNHRLRACYLWYLSTAPSQALTPFIASPDDLPKLVGTAGVDVAVCEAYNAGWQGRMGTHAHRRGGLELVQFYLRCAMTLLPQTSRLPRGRRLGGNDGRYLYLDEAGALTFRKRLTPFYR
jgi:hypothetical protein